MASHPTMTVVSPPAFVGGGISSQTSDDSTYEPLNVLNPIEIVSVLLAGQLRVACDPAIRQRLRSALFDLHVDIAHRIARSYAGRGCEAEDLDQVAQLGLVTAIDAFDPAKSTSFAAYAARTIRGTLRHYFRDATWLVRPPRGVQELRLSVQAVTPRLVQRLRREPTATELAAELDVSPADIDRARLAQANRTPASLDDHTTRIDAVSSGHPGLGSGALLALPLVDARDETDAAEWRIALRDLVTAMPVADQRILHARFVRELSQQAIAAELGVSQMHVSRRLRWMLDSLRSSLGLHQRAAG